MKRQRIVVLVVLAGLSGLVAWLYLTCTMPPEPISQADAERASEGKEVIVVAEVESRNIANPGTRSESAFYKLAVIDSLLGQAATHLSAGRYTRGRKHCLLIGRHYLLLLSPGRAPGGNAYGLRKFEPYAKERVDAVRKWLNKESKIGEQTNEPDQ